MLQEMPTAKATACRKGGHPDAHETLCAAFLGISLTLCLYAAMYGSRMAFATGRGERYVQLSRY